MRQALVAAGVLSILAFSGHNARSEEPESACVSCHRNIRQFAALEHSFKDWDQSTHAKSGVKCEACHGGNPSSQNKKEAHTGILRSTNKNSRMYFTKIPETCGSCHVPELNAFKKSDHYKELQGSGRGPNCVTCHGSMANQVIASEDMERTCTLCHRQPTQAYAARMALSESRAALRKLDVEIARVREAKTMDVGSQERGYRTLLDRFNGALIDWHAFNMRRVLSEAQEINKQAAASYTELKLKGRKL